MDPRDCSGSGLLGLLRLSFHEEATAFPRHLRQCTSCLLSPWSATAAATNDFVISSIAHPGIIEVSRAPRWSSVSFRSTGHGIFWSKSDAFGEPPARGEGGISSVLGMGMGMGGSVRSEAVARTRCPNAFGGSSVIVRFFAFFGTAVPSRVRRASADARPARLADSLAVSRSVGWYCSQSWNLQPPSDSSHRPNSWIPPTVASTSSRTSSRTRSVGHLRRVIVGRAASGTKPFRRRFSGLRHQHAAIVQSRSAESERPSTFGESGKLSSIRSQLTSAALSSLSNWVARQNEKARALRRHLAALGRWRRELSCPCPS